MFLERFHTNLSHMKNPMFEMLRFYYSSSILSVKVIHADFLDTKNQISKVTPPKNQQIMLTKSIEIFQKPHYSLNRGHPQQLLTKAGSTI